MHHHYFQRNPPAQSVVSNSGEVTPSVFSSSDRSPVKVIVSCRREPSTGLCGIISQESRSSLSKRLFRVEAKPSRRRVLFKRLFQQVRAKPGCAHRSSTGFFPFRLKIQATVSRCVKRSRAQVERIFKRILFQYLFPVSAKPSSILVLIFQGSPFQDMASGSVLC